MSTDPAGVRRLNGERQAGSWLVGWQPVYCQYLALFPRNLCWSSCHDQIHAGKRWQRLSSSAACAPSQRNCCHCSFKNTAVYTSRFCPRSCFLLLQRQVEQNVSSATEACKTSNCFHVLAVFFFFVCVSSSLFTEKKLKRMSSLCCHRG